ncbi:uncharacterized protein BO95DRAFT_446804 [Aspergillus brunneoviolaceus CBS 621.78]|uniref:Uncharacterized protein n=1 Tax=Aspergillus brunneoviolaceus CBS 621.78 TaxID=1450534 RepID=A0ACD1FXA8_9EURO|nr:hypothetical protein BO95DRAFT_446804 [Aspergillus brunneoviolaceus CBS 621.78]RAH41645.1 hypothetical protein BO95DRAFT_446804 [Aspergillus brunneoviolaceus CBS 621.78]
MGRRAYLNRLALGRSPYEAPDRSTGSAANPEPAPHRRVSALHADDYVQHYDERGHPINPESKYFGRELRRAKNDVLSTMGIVVSEEGNMGGPTEQQKIDMIAAENDYGLVMATLDQISVFLGSWWTSSLMGRILTFKSYTHVPLLSMIHLERTKHGIMGFYFAGIPAWAVSTCLSFLRHHPLDRLIAACQDLFPNDNVLSRLVRATLNILHSATRGSLLVLAIQTYMYSLLQSLHLVHPYSLVGLRALLPFGEHAPMQLPMLPNDLSPRSMVGFLTNILKTPSLLVYIYVYLRPVVEIRLYRLVRRRLPKPVYADDLSVKVAYDNDLIDWMMPALGRRADEENRRSNLTFMEDLAYEANFFRTWILSWFGFKTQLIGSSPEHTSETLRRRAQIESGSSGAQLSRDERQTQIAPQSRQEFDTEQVQRTAAPRSSVPGGTVTSDAIFNETQVLSNEENRMSLSPTEMSSGDYADMAPLRRAMALPLEEDQNNRALPRGDHAAEAPRMSRSSTLFSRPSSSATSSPASPLVRASLIHQNSDVITMQLEVLGNRHERNASTEEPRASNDPGQPHSNGGPINNQAISNLLDDLLANQGMNLATIVNTDALNSDGLSNMTQGISPGSVDTTPVSAENPQVQSSGANTRPIGIPTTNLQNALPDSTGTPDQTDMPQRLPEVTQTSANNVSSGAPPIASDGRAPQTSITDPHPIAHRVTILSSHPIDSLASHLASLITTLMFIPLESLYLRSLASSYLSATDAPAALRSDVHSMGLWASGGSRSSTLMYFGKVALMMGVQTAVNASVWGIISGAAIRIGRKYCGWGSL